MRISEREVLAMQDAMKNMSKKELKRMSAKTIKEMKRTSERVKSAPATLYHATKHENAMSVKENGIKTHDFYGEVYMCDTPEHCLHFVKPPCVIFEIDATKLNKKELYYSKDHNRKYFDFDCYTYYKNISASAITNIYEAGAHEERAR